MGFVYDPELQLHQLFPDEKSLEHIDDALTYLEDYKRASNIRLQKQISEYNPSIDVKQDIDQLAHSLAQVRENSRKTQENIHFVTSRIQKLDTTKQNLVLSMKVLKRLQMLINGYTGLSSVVLTRDYETIASYLGAVRELMEYFKSYKSIDEIASLYQQIHQTQNKLVDDVFIDFEDSFTNHFTNDKLRYGCEILELVDSKYKDKLLMWFYNLQLKEIQSIFDSGEAGSLENLNRRYIFYKRVLSNIQENYLKLFPASWGVDLELSKLFCKITNQEISAQLSAVSSSSTVILDALTATLAFEKNLNEIFKTDDFSKIVSASFEPYLMTWVKDQDALIRAKFIELYQRPKITNEIANPTSSEDLVNVIKVNNVPNFAESSSELFKIFSKSLNQTLKLSNGEILIDLSKLFGAYLSEYHQKILVPILKSAQEYPQGIEPIKYLTMLFNTADYVIKNTNDLQERITKSITESHKAKINFDSERSLYYDLIGKSIRTLVAKVSTDLDLSWRQFENNGWDSLEMVSDTSNYMKEMISTLIEDHRMICPLIIRDGYVRNYADKLIEQTVSDFMNKLKLIKPISIIAIEQILFDISCLKSLFSCLLLFADPNFDYNAVTENEKSKVPRPYTRHLNNQFFKLETLLKTLLTPTLPVDNIVDSYFNLVGDKSVDNFKKLLELKSVSSEDQTKYVESFKLQALSRKELMEDSSIFSALDKSNEVEDLQALSQQSPPPVDFKEVINSRSPEPTIPDFLKPNAAKMHALKINNALRDFSINGENQVNKFNENFKSIGKFFRKDNPEPHDS